MTDDALVIFTPSGKRGRFAIGTPVLTAARQLGVDLDSVCGGRGICSKCQITPGYGEFPKHGVTVAEDALSEWNAVEDRYKRIRGLLDGRRLGCQARLMGDVVIDVPPESQVHKQVIRKSATERVMVMDPATRAVYVEVEEPDMHEPTGDFERLARALAAQWQVDKIETDLSVLRKLQPVLRKGEWKVTVVLHKGNHDVATRVLDIFPGFHEGPLLGLAVDLGSTTIAAHLCDLSDGRVLASSGLMNPQIRFGEDLMSRVSYAMMNPGGDVEMTRVVREAINTLAKAIAEEAGVDPEAIYEMVIVFNPVMHHLFLGVDPVELGQAPFALATSGSLSLDARDVDLTTLNRNARVYVLPCIAGHVGADCTAVALSEQPNQSKDMVLIVDVGTNAEILLGNETRVLACSSPTGPAWEGAQISSGQRAASCRSAGAGAGCAVAAAARRRCAQPVGAPRRSGRSAARPQRARRRPRAGSAEACAGHPYATFCRGCAPAAHYAGGGRRRPPRRSQRAGQSLQRSGGSQGAGDPGGLARAPGHRVVPQPHRQQPSRHCRQR